MHLAIVIRSGFWFVPGLLVLGCVTLALLTVEVDRHLGTQLRTQWPRLFDTRPDSAREILSTTASSMITVAGVVFSITLVAVTLASSQYTSRVLRNFMRDRTNQVVLGAFLGVYAYCLAVLRTVSGADDGFVPALAVLLALVLVALAIAALIYFIHHIVVSLQAGEIARTITQDTLQTIGRMFPEPASADSEYAAVFQRTDMTGWQAVPARAMGYIQSVDPDAMLALAREHDTALGMARNVGDFVVEGRALARVRLPQPPDDEFITAVNRLYAIDAFRTTDHDPAFGLRQLVDIALKALSPGINDTTTAITCLDHLSAILQQLAERRLDAASRVDGDVARFVACEHDFGDFVALAFDQITEYAEGNAFVLARLFGVVREVLDQTRVADRRELLFRRLDILGEAAERSVRSPHGKRGLREAMERARGEGV